MDELGVPRPLSAQAQHIRDNWSPQRIADELYRVTNGVKDWRRPEDKPQVTSLSGENTNGPIQTRAAKLYAQELEAAINRHPSGKALTPAPPVPGSKPVKHHPPRVR